MKYLLFIIGWLILTNLVNAQVNADSNKDVIKCVPKSFSFDSYKPYLHKMKIGETITLSCSVSTGDIRNIHILHNHEDITATFEKVKYYEYNISKHQFRK